MVSKVLSHFTWVNSNDVDEAHENLNPVSCISQEHRDKCNPWMANHCKDEIL